MSLTQAMIDYKPRVTVPYKEVGETSKFEKQIATTLQCWDQGYRADFDAMKARHEAIFQEELRLMRVQYGGAIDQLNIERDKLHQMMAKSQSLLDEQIREKVERKDTLQTLDDKVNIIWESLLTK